MSHWQRLKLAIADCSYRILSLVFAYSIAAMLDNVVMVDRDEDGLARVVKSLTGDESRVSLHAFDICEDAEVEKLVESIPKDHGSLDYAV